MARRKVAPEREGTGPAVWVQQKETVWSARGDNRSMILAALTGMIDPRMDFEPVRYRADGHWANRARAGEVGLNSLTTVIHDQTFPSQHVSNKNIRFRTPRCHDAILWLHGQGSINRARKSCRLSVEIESKGFGPGVGTLAESGPCERSGGL